MAQPPRCELRHTEEKGRLYVAVVDLEAGDLLLEDAAFGLPSNSGESGLPPPYGVLVPDTSRLAAECCCCCGPLPDAPGAAPKCGGACGLSFCSSACRDSEAGAVHALECPLVPAGVKSIAEEAGVDVHYVWLALRAILASHVFRARGGGGGGGGGGPGATGDPWEDLAVLETHRDRFEAAQLARFERAAALLLAALPEAPRASVAPTEARVASLLCAVRVNAYGFPDGLLSGCKGFGLYPRLSLMAHSCEPNAAFVASRGRLAVRANRRVPAGSEVAVSYVDLWKPTAARRAYLRATKFFECSCPRCSSPDEGGRCLSGVRCPHDGCGGYAHAPAGGGEGRECAACGRPAGDLAAVAAAKDRFLGAASRGGTPAEEDARIAEARAALEAVRPLLHGRHAMVRDMLTGVRGRLIARGRHAEAAEIMAELLEHAEAVLPPAHAEKAHAQRAGLPAAERARALTAALDCYRRCGEAVRVLEGPEGPDVAPVAAAVARLHALLAPPPRPAPRRPAR
eukprot:tig00000498_g1598.t1